MEYFLFAPGINCTQYLDEEEKKNVILDLKEIPGVIKVYFTFEQSQELGGSKIMVQKMTVLFNNQMQHYDIEDAWSEVLNYLEFNEYIFI